MDLVSAFADHRPKLVHRERLHHPADPRLLEQHRASESYSFTRMAISQQERRKDSEERQAAHDVQPPLDRVVLVPRLRYGQSSG